MQVKLAPKSKVYICVSLHIVIKCLFIFYSNASAVDSAAITTAVADSASVAMASASTIALSQKPHTQIKLPGIQW